MAMSAKPFLIDGPLMMAPERRAAVLECMARDLVDDDAIAERGDAVRALHARGYVALDIMILVEEARALAFQEIVSKEMSEP
jgi:hypothetical protein